MSRFRDALQSGRALLMDGAMGTELQRHELSLARLTALASGADESRIRARLS